MNVTKLYAALNLVHKRMEILEAIPVPNTTVTRDILECRYYFLMCKEVEIVEAIKENVQNEMFLTHQDVKKAA